MPVSPPSFLQLRLSAHNDGETGEQERHDIDALLVNDPQARAQQDSLKRGTEAGRRFFEDLLKEPVPLEMVRTIKNAPLPRRAVRLPNGPRSPVAFRPSGPQALAGCLLFLALGGGIGYMFGANPAGPDISALAAPASDERDWLDDVVATYRLYERQPKHLAEIGPDGKADILEWLTTNTGVGFRIPDLSESGLTFAGARLVAAKGHPLGVLFYKRSDGDGDVVAITFAKSSPDLGKSIEDIRSDTALVSWNTALATYVVVGPSSAADLDDIAAKAAGLI
ncbi:anti-sigma factor [Neorhizobium lilium]|uniref:Anti-sigma factor n=1 Tax=Neorhizobium lilium TaxID=2503024 RepID=A0A3S3TZT7_9HYPH|nr:anti-sigma factor [Neorhizobium lilium]RWX78664.1 anti-sigma factor [Neorhizobium lilium]